MLYAAYALLAAFSLESIKTFFNKVVQVGTIPLKMWALCLAALALIIFIILAAVLIASPSGKNKDSKSAKGKGKKGDNQADSTVKESTSDTEVKPLVSEEILANTAADISETSEAPATAEQAPEATPVDAEAPKASEKPKGEACEAAAEPTENANEAAAEPTENANEAAADSIDEPAAESTNEAVAESIDDVNLAPLPDEDAQAVSNEVTDEPACPIISVPDENILDKQADAEAAALYTEEARETPANEELAFTADVSESESTSDEVISDIPEATEEANEIELTDENMSTDTEEMNPLSDITDETAPPDATEETQAVSDNIVYEPSCPTVNVPDENILDKQADAETAAKYTEEAREQPATKVEAQAKAEAKPTAPKAVVVDTEATDLEHKDADDTEKKGAVGKYEIALRFEGYCFSLIANNGQLLYDSYGFTTVEGAARGIETFKKAVSDGGFSVNEDKFGRFKFILSKRYQGQNYKTKISCERSVQSVIRFAANSKIVIVDPTPEELAVYTEAFRTLKKPTDIDWEAVAAEEQNTPKLGTFEIYADVNNNYYFCLIANNGQILYNSSPYASAVTARKAIDSFKRAVYIGNFFIDKDKFGRYRYIIRSSSTVTYAGEAYDSEIQAKKSTESVKRFVKSATIVPFKREEPDTDAE